MHLATGCDRIVSSSRICLYSYISLLLLAIDDPVSLESKYLGRCTTQELLKQLHTGFKNIHYVGFVSKMTSKMLKKLFSCTLAPARTARHFEYRSRHKKAACPRGNRNSKRKSRNRRKLTETNRKLERAPEGTPEHTKLEKLRQFLETEKEKLNVSAVGSNIEPLAKRLQDAMHDDRKHVPIEDGDVADGSRPVTDPSSSSQPGTREEPSDATAPQIDLMVKLTTILLSEPHIYGDVDADLVTSKNNKSSNVTLSDSMLEMVATAVRFFRPFYPKMLGPSEYCPNHVLLRMPMLKICGEVLRVLGFPKDMHAVVPEVAKNCRYALRLTGPILNEMFTVKNSPGCIAIEDSEPVQRKAPKFSLSMISAFFDIDGINERCKNFNIPFNNA